MRQGELFGGIAGRAEIEGDYRYSLGREWDRARGTVNYIMLNPSTADASEDDPTITRCVERARRLGYGEIVVTNLFAYRSTAPARLLDAPDPIGPENDDRIRAHAASADLVIVGWGSIPYKQKRLRPRVSRVVSILIEELKAAPYAVRLTGEGYPWHPLYVPYDVQLIPFPRA